MQARQHCIYDPELKLGQILPTQIEVDNRAARQFTNAQQPTRRTRHIDMKDFVIMQWTEEERIIYKDVKSQHNPSDTISKQTGRTKFYEHRDILMGHHRPKYTNHLKMMYTIFPSTYSVLDYSLIDESLELYKCGEGEVEYPR